MGIPIWGDWTPGGMMHKREGVDPEGLLPTDFEGDAWGREAELQEAAMEGGEEDG
ncbi:hypothetical protein ACFL0I_03815 [Gemmatimonadota bacterium]